MKVRNKRHHTQWAGQFGAAHELIRRGYSVTFTMGTHRVPIWSAKALSGSSLRFRLNPSAQRRRGFVKSLFWTRLTTSSLSSFSSLSQQLRRLGRTLRAGAPSTTFWAINNSSKQSVNNRSIARRLEKNAEVPSRSSLLASTTRYCRDSRRKWTSLMHGRICRPDAGR